MAKSKNELHRPLRWLEFPVKSDELWKTLSKNSMNHDVTLQSAYLADENTFIQCHRSVLSSQSAYFSWELAAHPGKLVFLFQEFSHPILLTVVKHIYSQQEKSRKNVTLTEENVFQVYEAAQKFQLEVLQSQCLTLIMESMDSNDIIKTIKFARENDRADMMRVCVNHILNNFEEAFVEDFDVQIVLAVIDNLPFGNPPDNVLRFVISWLKKKNQTELQQYAFQLLKKIKLSRISKHVLAEIFCENKFLREIPHINDYYTDCLVDSSIKNEPNEPCTSNADRVKIKFKTLPTNTRDQESPDRELDTLPEFECANKRSRMSSSCSSSSKRQTTKDIAGRFKHQPECSSTSTNSPSPSQSVRTSKFQILFCDHKSLRLMNLEDPFYSTSFGYNVHLTPASCILHHNGKIYCIGGYDYRNLRSLDGGIHVQVFDAKSKKIIPDALPSIPGYRTDFKCVLLNDAIYVIGGKNEEREHVHRVQRLQLSKNGFAGEANCKWESIVGTLHGRCDFGVCVLNECIYILGGLEEMKGGGSSLASSMECYDPEKNAWEPKCSMPTKRMALAAAAVDGRIYALGGSKFVHKYYKAMYDCVEIYDPKADSWVVGMPMKEKRSQFSVVYKNNHIYALGGNISQKTTMEKYDLTRDRWESMAAPHGLYENVAWYN